MMSLFVFNTLVLMILAFSAGCTVRIEPGWLFLSYVFPLLFVWTWLLIGINAALQGKL